MAYASDLVVDSRLETRFPNAELTKHVFYEADPLSNQREIRRTEYWRREKRAIGAGGSAQVWLEECWRGKRKGQLRAVKQIWQPPHSDSNATEYHRELEAIAKFSHPNVRLFYSTRNTDYPSNAI